MAPIQAYTLKIKAEAGIRNNLMELILCHYMHQEWSYQQCAKNTTQDYTYCCVVIVFISPIKL